MPDNVIIHDERTVFEKFFFRIIEATLQHERFDGDMTDRITRLSFERGDSVAAILHNPQADTVVLIEQFRYPTVHKGRGWIYELPAGSIEEGEDADDTMHREITEETGYQVESLQHIRTFFSSPGGSSERIHLFYASVSESQNVDDGGGVEDEHEDIRTHRVALDEAFAMLDDGRIDNATTIIGLQWLHRHRSTLD